MADNLVYLDYHAKHDNRTRRAGRNPCSHLPGGVAASWKAAGCCSVKERSCPHTGCGRRGRKNFVLALLTDTGTDTASASAQVTSVTKLNKNFPRRERENQLESNAPLSPKDGGKSGAPTGKSDAWSQTERAGHPPRALGCENHLTLPLARR